MSLEHAYSLRLGFTASMSVSICFPFHEKSKEFVYPRSFLVQATQRAGLLVLFGAVSVRLMNDIHAAHTCTLCKAYGSSAKARTMIRTLRYLHIERMSRVNSGLLVLLNVARGLAKISFKFRSRLCSAIFSLCRVHLLLQVLCNLKTTNLTPI
jgi:hypothetical protein